MTEFDEDALGDSYALAIAAEKRGDGEAASRAYLDCLDIDPADHVGARIRLAGLGRGDVPDRVGDTYVATLFDQHAEAFEDILVRQLRYGVPELLAERLGSKGRRYARVLDLGCGTGLAGEALEHIVDELSGVDLSEEMIRIAGEKDLYQKLFVAEVVAFLDRHDDPEPYDLIVAADVLPYLGALDSFFESCSKRLAPGGRLGFSTETMTEEALSGQPFAVGRAQRFHHGERYVRDILARYGFAVEHFDLITVRMQDGFPAAGHLVIAQNA